MIISSRLQKYKKENILENLVEAKIIVTMDFSDKCFDEQVLCLKERFALYIKNISEETNFGKMFDGFKIEIINQKESS